MIDVKKRNTALVKENLKFLTQNFCITSEM